jgi:hypothetical protein
MNEVRGVCLLNMPIFKPGDPPPPDGPPGGPYDGRNYSQWMEWARVQNRARLRQRRCSMCGLWRFPQELRAGVCVNETRGKSYEPSP